MQTSDQIGTETDYVCMGFGRDAISKHDRESNPLDQKNPRLYTHVVKRLNLHQSLERRRQDPMASQAPNP